MFTKSTSNDELVVAHLAERSLLIPEAHGSNPVIGKNAYRPRINC